MPNWNIIASYANTNAEVSRDKYGSNWNIRCRRICAVGLQTRGSGALFIELASFLVIR